MRKTINILFTLFLGLIMFASCEPNAINEEKLFLNEQQVQDLIQDGKLYTLHEFVDSFMTEKGNYLSDTTLYRTRGNNESVNPGIHLFAIDTLPSYGEGIYIRGRVTTDDFGGNFYKSLCIQQIVDGKQQALRLSVDAGSASGMYPLGQEIIIRCNGFAIGRYANQIQLCVPSYNNNKYAQNAGQKIGWAPGRIPFARFRIATQLVGTPDKSKLHCDTLTIGQIISSYKVKEARREDGKLICIKDIYYTGEYESTSGLQMCTTGDPEIDEYANVFAPTTKNVGYPQSRVISDGSDKTLVSMSEYAKQANFYIPGADSLGVTHCPEYIGSVTGILSYYMDNASYAPDQWNWAISIRDLNDLSLFKTDAEGNKMPWVPTEYTKQ